MSGRQGLSIVAIVWAIAVVLAVHFVDFPGSVPDFRRASGGGTLLDITPAFSEDAIYARLEGYGPAGRENYAFRNVSVDVLLPFSVLPALVLLARRSVARLSVRGLRYGVLLSLPFVYVVFDLVENGLVLAMLREYPARLPSVAAILPYVTGIKRAASLLAVFAPLALLVYGRFRKPHLG